MYGGIRDHLRRELESIREGGLYKEERVIDSPQGAEIVVGGRRAINFCANNYLGLANHPDILRAANDGLKRWGYGLASVRFICGTQGAHKQLEETITRFHGSEDSILYTSCFDANGGVFEPLLGEEDAIISDALNHASIIDGIRLCKAQRYRYAHSDMNDLEAQLKAAASARFRLIATDGVFSMDGDVANLKTICDLAERYDALVMVDEAHATGFFGPTGRGAYEHCGVQGRVDIVNSTLGKALGGASGGFATGRREIIEFLRQRSRTYLFSNSLAPALVAGSIAAFELLSKTTALREKLMRLTVSFRTKMRERGFELKQGEHPIVPIMLGDARLAQEMARALLDEQIYVIGFSYPVVPKGQARIRVQISAAHEPAHIDQAVEAFTRVGKAMGVLSGV
jgi:glycine C-acetyltransferase